jgi:hypothetical protein
MKNSDAAVLRNQKTIISNQKTIIVNQKKMMGNQGSIVSNQKHIMGNQKVIVGNQSSIISNQKQIVDNQVALSVLSQSQALVLNLVKKVAGQTESQQKTNAYLSKLKIKTQKSIAKSIKGSKAL